MSSRKLPPLQRKLPTTPGRSRIMAGIRGKGNKTTEIRLIRIMKANGIKGWRRNFGLEGNPDFVFPNSRLVIFVDGCFWHGCNKCFIEPKHNVSYWREKIRRNIARDKRNVRQLRKNGWSVIRLWEHALKNPDAVVRRISHKLKKNKWGQTPIY